MNSDKQRKNTVNPTQTEAGVYFGNCLCEGVSFKIHGKLQDIQICHCSECRKAQGTAFATNIPVLLSNFELIEGQSLIKEYPSSTVNGKYRAFCRDCGSPVYSRLESKPDALRLRAGLLKGPLDTKLSSHAYTSEKANWWEINDRLPQHARQRN